MSEYDSSRGNTLRELAEMVDKNEVRVTGLVRRIISQGEDEDGKQLYGLSSDVGHFKTSIMVPSGTSRENPLLDAIEHIEFGFSVFSDFTHLDLTKLKEHLAHHGWKIEYVGTEQNKEINDNGDIDLEINMSLN